AKRRVVISPPWSRRYRSLYRVADVRLAAVTRCSCPRRGAGRIQTQYPWSSWLDAEPKPEPDVHPSTPRAPPSGSVSASSTTCVVCSEAAGGNADAVEPGDAQEAGLVTRSRLARTRARRAPPLRGGPWTRGAVLARAGPRDAPCRGPRRPARERAAVLGESRRRGAGRGGPAPGHRQVGGSIPEVVPPRPRQ